jgi:uncharacterized membrane protein (DUF485 family)
MSTGAIIAIIVLVLAIIASNIYLVKKSAKFGIKPDVKETGGEKTDKRENSKKD